MKFSKTILATVLPVLAAGCAITPQPELQKSAARTEAEKTTAKLDKSKYIQAESGSKLFTSKEEAYIPLLAGAPKAKLANSWLKSVKVSLQVGSDPIPLTGLLGILAKQGINITSELPLDKFYYSGFSLTNVDAEVALRTILTASGLDYAVDPELKLVTVKPVTSKTWYLNTGNRKSEYKSEGSKNAGSAGDRSAANSTGVSNIATTEQFWVSLKEEMDLRLKVTLPAPATPKVALNSGFTESKLPAMPALPGSTGAAASSIPLPPLTPATKSEVKASGGDDSSGLKYSTVTVGTYALNPETGAVSVQAPHWILEGLDAYFKNVQDMYNTDIVFEGELLMLTTTSGKSEGLDISSFGKFMNNKYKLAYQSTSNGIKITTPSSSVPIEYDATQVTPNQLLNNIPAISSSLTGVTGPLLGIQSLSNGLQIFSSYLSNLGTVTSLQKPIISTTSGVPADFRKTVTRYFNTVSQSAASGGSGSAAVATSNTLVPQEFGTTLRVNPRYDTATGLVRAQIELVQTVQVGSQAIPQTITAGSNVSQVTTDIPIVTKILYSGETLLKDGDLVVMGGQSESSDETTRNGIPGLMDAPGVGGVFGSSSKLGTTNTFYFALKVSVTKRK